jgi:hypothetical protein
MRFDLHLRSTCREQIMQLAERMKLCEEQPRLSDYEKKRISERISPFAHTTNHNQMVVAGAEGSGDFPCVAYGDSFIYVAVARTAIYKTDTISGLREVGPEPEAVFHFSLIPGDNGERLVSIDEAFASLAGASLSEIIESSDYQHLKAAEARRASSSDNLRRNLIRPHAADAGNIGIQLRTTAELGAVLRLLRSDIKLSYVLIGGTLSLPLVGKPDVSLFYEHLKRLCCVEARKRGTGFFTISKAHGFPSIETVEELARGKSGAKDEAIAEHWYLRLPVRGVDRWETTLTQTRRLPPPGTVTYLVRFHSTSPTVRLDMDREFWLRAVHGATEDTTRANEERIFGSLDYLTHDQRCYGYPYPLRAAHDRATLSMSERIALRKQVIDVAVRAGMKRSLFREVTQGTHSE